MTLRRLFCLGATLALVASLGAELASAEPRIADAAMAKKLLGTHAITLQWLGTGTLRDAGKAVVAEKDGEWHLTGRQDAAEGFVEIDGIVTAIDGDSFAFTGRIITQVTHINGGRACTRDGAFTFLKKGKRKYWRTQSIDNPCDLAADYVDLYLR